MTPFRKHREIRPELLDDQPPARAQRSLQDLVRINRLLGGHAVLRRTLRRLVDPRQGFTVLDVGAGSGDAGSEIRKHYPSARVVALDYRLHHFQRWDGPRVAADAFHLPFGAGTFDYAHCSLFLHHFSDADVTHLLRSFGRVARRAVIVNDLERHWVPYYFLPATRWLFGWDPITLHDGPVSVQAGWSPAELRRLALAAGFARVTVRLYRPSFRVVLVASGLAGNVQ